MFNFIECLSEKQWHIVWWTFGCHGVRSIWYILSLSLLLLLHIKLLSSDLVFPLFKVQHNDHLTNRWGKIAKNEISNWLWVSWCSFRVHPPGGCVEPAQYPGCISHLLRGLRTVDGLKCHFLRRKKYRLQNIWYYI